jgi:predicted SAM-dependent methyltransferase
MLILERKWNAACTREVVGLSSGNSPLSTHYGKVRDAVVDFSNTKISLRRPVTSYLKVQKLIGAMVRNRQVFFRRKAEGCYLDLGCGPNVSPEFCNIDYHWRPGSGVVCWDVTRGLPFPDGYVGGIFTEHMLEHIPFEKALGVLTECRRVLRPGGVLRIVVPDGELYLSEYANHLRGEAANIPFASSDVEYYPIATPIVSVNRIFRDHGHCFIWDYETLRLGLLRAGFTEVSRCAFGQGGDTRLLRDTPSRQVESLYVEAW